MPHGGLQTLCWRPLLVPHLTCDPYVCLCLPVVFEGFIKTVDLTCLASSCVWYSVLKYSDNTPGSDHNPGYVGQPHLPYTPALPPLTSRGAEPLLNTIFICCFFLHSPRRSINRERPLKPWSTPWILSTTLPQGSILDPREDLLQTFLSFVFCCCHCLATTRFSLTKAETGRQVFGQHLLAVSFRSKPYVAVRVSGTFGLRTEQVQLGSGGRSHHCHVS